MGEVEPPYILDEYHRFLEGVAKWIDGRWHLDRFDFAANAIREANQVFVGIGAYSVNEVFFLAGMLQLRSPGQTKLDVGSPYCRNSNQCQRMRPLRFRFPSSQAV